MYLLDCIGHKPWMILGGCKERRKHDGKFVRPTNSWHCGRQNVLSPTMPAIGGAYKFTIVLPSFFATTQNHPWLPLWPSQSAVLVQSLDGPTQISWYGWHGLFLAGQSNPSSYTCLRNHSQCCGQSAHVLRL